MSYESLIINAIRESRRRQHRFRVEESVESAGMITEVLAMSEQIFAAYSEFENGSLMIAINLGDNVFKSAQIPNVTRENAEVIFNNIYGLLVNGNPEDAVTMMFDTQLEYAKTEDDETAEDADQEPEEDEEEATEDQEELEEADGARRNPYADLGFEPFASFKYRSTYYGGPWRKSLDLGENEDDIDLVVEFVIADNMTLYATVVEYGDTVAKYSAEDIPDNEYFKKMEDELMACSRSDEVDDVLTAFDFEQM